MPEKINPTLALYRMHCARKNKRDKDKLAGAVAQVTALAQVPGTPPPAPPAPPAPESATAGTDKAKA